MTTFFDAHVIREPSEFFTNAWGADHRTDVAHWVSLSTLVHPCVLCFGVHNACVWCVMCVHVLEKTTRTERDGKALTHTVYCRLSPLPPLPLLPLFLPPLPPLPLFLVLNFKRPGFLDFTQAFSNLTANTTLGQAGMFSCAGRFVLCVCVRAWVGLSDSLPHVENGRKQHYKPLKSVLTWHRHAFAGKVCGAILAGSGCGRSIVRRCVCVCVCPSLSLSTSLSTSRPLDLFRPLSLSLFMTTPPLCFVGRLFLHRVLLHFF